MIMKGRAPLRLPLAGLLALVLTAAVALPAFATNSSQQTPPPPPPPPPAVKPTATQALPSPAPPPPPPPSAQTPQPTRRVVTPPRYLLKELTRPDLPADGKQLVEAFEKDRQAIQEEIKRKVDLRREELVKALEALQEQYTKAGKLDEAVAIRDYLRTGQVGRDAWFDVGKAWNVRRD